MKPREVCAMWCPKNKNTAAPHRTFRLHWFETASLPAMSEISEGSNPSPSPQNFHTITTTTTTTTAHTRT